MKILITLLCFYFAGIVSMPCQDNVGIENHCQSEDNCGDESDDHNECQPFCNCACCSTVIIDQLVSIEMSAPIVGENSHFLYVIESSSKFLPSIWQPPQLS
ncbi:MAG: DUF6660 family protein [Bacteroidia bacterium]